MLIPLLAALAAPAQTPAAPAKPPVSDEQRILNWEKDVKKIEERLAKSPPPADAVVFVGSSSIVRWDLAKAFPGRPAVNVGFGGSQVRDSAHYAARLLAAAKPARIVFYSGDNDLKAGRTPKQLADDFRAFVAAAPEVPVWFLAVKPSPSRWAFYEAQREANRLVREFCATDARLHFVDVVPLMLGPDGKPREELYVADKLHLSPAGYAVWNAELKRQLGWE